MILQLFLEFTLIQKIKKIRYIRVNSEISFPDAVLQRQKQASQRDVHDCIRDKIKHAGTRYRRSKNDYKDHAII